MGKELEEKIIKALESGAATMTVLDKDRIIVRASAEPKDREIITGISEVMSVVSDWLTAKYAEASKDKKATSFISIRTRVQE